MTKFHFFLKIDEFLILSVFFEDAKKNKENKVRILTKYGNIEIELFKKTPYHRANFIYLKKTKKYQC